MTHEKWRLQIFTLRFKQVLIDLIHLRAVLEAVHLHRVLREMLRRKTSSICSTRLGIETGIDVKKVCEAVAIIAPHVSRPIETGMYRLFENGQL